MFNFFKTSDRTKKEAASLICEANKYALESMKRYEHEMDIQADHAIAIFKYRKEKTKARMVSSLNKVQLCGFEAEAKVNRFQNNEMRNIFIEEWAELQNDLRSLTSKMYKSQIDLKNDFEEILMNLRSSCKKIRAPQPELQFLDLEKLIQSSENNSQIIQTVCIAASTVGALLLLPSSAVAAQGTGGIVVAAQGTAQGTTHVVAHGTGHVVAHGTGHVIAHGTAQVAAHGTAQVVGVVIPGLNILLAGYSLYCIGKFFFDDSQVKEDLINHIERSLESVYGTAINGSYEDCGLYGQFQDVKTKFGKAIKCLYEESIQPTVDLINT